VTPCERDGDLRAAIAEAESLFHECMEDDFNTAGAIGAVFDLIRATNISLGRLGGIDYDAVEQAANFLRMVDEVMGIIAIDSAGETGRHDDNEIESMIAERYEARKNKNFARSDEIRDALSVRGIILEDTPQGTRWKRA
jgi:cysteinyl-tRNA synthetase